METLVQHQNQYYSRSKSQFSNRFGYYPSRGGFKGMNCRNFEPSIGILTSPPMSPSFNNNHEPKSPRVYSEPTKPSKRSSPIAITPKPTTKGHSFNEVIEELTYSELWAGPAFSNSPPPSSLPMPKFSLRQKRAVSLDLPLPSHNIELHPVSKSEPSSPRRDFFSSATEDLRRILHLDIADD